MKQVTINERVYHFEELTPEAQDKAIEELANIIQVDVFYAESILEDAKEAGINIDEYDLYRRTIGGKLTESAEDVANKIIADHGPDCDTYKTARAYLGELSTLKGIHGIADMEDEDLDTEDIDNDFRRAILEDYLSLLRREYEYQGSREAIIETINANEYGFFEDGKRTHHIAANF